MMDSDTIRSRPQINPQQPTGAPRPTGPITNINANLAGPRPPPPQGQQPQNPIRGPPPLRRADSRQFIPGQPPLAGQQRPPLQQQPSAQFPPGQRPINPSAQAPQQYPQQPRPQNPNSAPIIRPNNPLQQPIRPVAPNQQQQPIRPPIRPQGPTQNSTPNRPPVPQTQTQPQTRPTSASVRQPSPAYPQAPYTQNSSEKFQSSFDPINMSADISVLRTEPPRPSSVLSNDDDDDVVMGKSSPLRTPVSSAKVSESRTDINQMKSPTNPVPLQRTDSRQYIPSRPPSSTDYNQSYTSESNPRPPSQTDYKMSENTLPKISEKPSKDLTRPSSVTFKEEPKVEKIKSPSPDIPNPKIKSPLSLNSIINPDRSSSPSSNRHEDSHGGLKAKSSASERVTTPTSEKFRTTPLSKADMVNGEFKRGQKLRSSLKFKGDNDSGVDETTQGNERNDPELCSPLKSPTKIPGFSRPPSATPSNRSQDKDRRSVSKTRSLKTPDPAENIKKVPMNKIQVGNAPSPNLKQIKSKIGSLENATHKPGGGHVKIEHRKLEIKATPRIEAKNDKYTPGGGDKKITSNKLQWSAKSKIGSLENAHHKPGGGDKKIEYAKTEFKDKAKPKVGSKDNVKYVPGGGDFKSSIIEDPPLEEPKLQIQTHKVEIHATSKVGSLNNVKHKPGGGEKKIFDDKDYLKNIEHPISPSQPSQLASPVQPGAVPGADENLNEEFN